MDEAFVEVLMWIGGVLLATSAALALWLRFGTDKTTQEDGHDWY